MESIENYSTS